ncbi:MAG: MFS transporter [Phycisphaerae bacterium]
MPPTLLAAMIVLLEGLSFGLTLPVLPEFCTALGGTASTAGLLFALVSGPKVFTNPMFGGLSDRIGRRPVLAINTLGTLAGSIAWAASRNLSMLAISRLVTGVFSAQAGLAQAIVADKTSPQRRAAAMGMLGAAFGIAFSLGPAVGGWVAHHYSNATVGWICASMQIISLCVIAFVLPESRPREERLAHAQSGANRSARELFGEPNVLVLLIVTAAMTLGTSHLISTFSLVGRDCYAFSVEMSGYAFGTLGLVGIIVQGGLIRPMSARFGERAVAQAGLAILAVGLLLVAMQAPAWSFWLAASLVGLGSALAVPCLSSLLSRCVGKADQGGINGLSQSALAIGRAGGNAMGGGLYHHGGVSVCYSVAAGFVLSSTLVLARFRAAGVAADETGDDIGDTNFATGKPTAREPADSAH